MTWTPLRVGLLAGSVFALLAPRAISVPSAAAVQDTATKAELSELWIEPEAGRDLFAGVGGVRLGPSPSATYSVLKTKKGGFSDGYTVSDPTGRMWSAKLYPEARTEVVASRLVWGLGYHQPPIYLLEQWTADGASGENPQPVARFREETPAFHGLMESGPWSYADNPFVGTPQLSGLLVLQIMMTNADLKPANNMLYTLSDAHEGARRWYVARDLGQTFGRSGVLSATRDDIEAFDDAGFITGVKDGIVRFEYHGLQVGLTRSITPRDVRWICQRLSLLTDKQWSDAFRAGGYVESTAQRYIRRMKLKIAEGLALQDS